MNESEVKPKYQVKVMRHCTQNRQKKTRLAWNVVWGYMHVNPSETKIKKIIKGEAWYKLATPRLVNLGRMQNFASLPMTFTLALKLA